MDTPLMVVKTTVAGKVVIPIPVSIQQYNNFPESAVIVSADRPAQIPVGIWDWIRKNTAFVKNGMLFDAAEEDNKSFTVKAIKKVLSGSDNRFRKFIYDNVDSVVKIDAMLSVAESVGDESRLNELQMYRSILLSGLPVDIETYKWEEIGRYWNKKWGSIEKYRRTKGDSLKSKRDFIRLLVNKRSGVRIS